MLGVRKGELGVKVSLLGNDVILMVFSLPSHASRKQLLLARGTLSAPDRRKKRFGAWEKRGRRPLVLHEIN
jgi:hypothetical protein